MDNFERLSEKKEKNERVVVNVPPWLVPMVRKVLKAELAAATTTDAQEPPSKPRQKTPNGPALLWKLKHWRPAPRGTDSIPPRRRRHTMDNHHHHPSHPSHRASMPLMPSSSPANSPGTFTPAHGASSPSSPFSSPKSTPNRPASLSFGAHPVNSQTPFAGSRMAHNAKVLLDEPLKHFHLVEALRTNDLETITSALQRILSQQSYPGAPQPSYGTPLHLAISLSSRSIVEHIVNTYCGAATSGGDTTLNGNSAAAAPGLDWVNKQNSPDGQTPLHLVAKLGRYDLVDLLFKCPQIDDTVRDAEGRTAEDIAKDVRVIDMLKNQRNDFSRRTIGVVQSFLASQSTKSVVDYFANNRRANSYLQAGWVDINSPIDPKTEQGILHFAAKAEDMMLMDWALERGADPEIKDKKGKKPLDVQSVYNSVDHSHPIFAPEMHRPPAIVQTPILSRDLQQATSSTTGVVHHQSPTLQGNLLKWTNYAAGYKSRYFVLEKGVLSYYKSEQDYPHSCRGSISTLIAQVEFPDSSDKSRFDVLGKGSVRYSLKARSPAEAKKWVWALREPKRWKQQGGGERKSTDGKAPAVGVASLSEVDENQAASMPALDVGQSSVDLNREGSFDSSGRRPSNGFIDTATPPSGLRYSHDGSDGHASLHHVGGPNTSQTSIGGPDATPLDAYPAEPGSLPHESTQDHEFHVGEDFQTLIYLLKVQMDVQQRVIGGLVEILEDERLASVQRGAAGTPSDPNGLSDAGRGGSNAGAFLQTVDLSNIPSLLKSSSEHVQETINKIVRVAENRERTWHRKWKREVESRLRWEEVVRKVFGIPLDQMDGDSFGMIANHGFMGMTQQPGVMGGAPNLAGPGSSNTTATVPTTQSVARKPSVITQQSKGSTTGGSIKAIRVDEGTDSDTVDDDEDEFDGDVFYDAMDGANGGEEGAGGFIEQVFGFEPLRAEEEEILHSPIPTVEQSKAMASSMAATASAGGTPSTALIPASAFLTPADLEGAMSGYIRATQRRTGLPLDPTKAKPTLNVWSFLKSAIGKDLSKVTLPVFFNEPLSMLQRMCEDVEYIELLNVAARVGRVGVPGGKASAAPPPFPREDDPAATAVASLTGGSVSLDEFEALSGDDASLVRLMYVAAYAISNYSSTAGRTGKPFNPMLGETYEIVDDAKKYRYVSEQVCHHPPISACFSESPDFKFWTEVNVKSKFWAKSLELHPLGTCHVQLPLHSSSSAASLEHFTWRKVTTSVQNLIVGKMWIDHYGDMVVRNWRTGEEAVITFKSRNTGGGWFGGGGGGGGGGNGEPTLSGVVKDASGIVRWEVKGSWDDALIAYPAAAGKNTPAFLRKPLTLWNRYPIPANSAANFNYTRFAMTLNELPSALKGLLPPTDCRLRPDQRAMEEGRWDDANAGKEALEMAQRERRKGIVKKFQETGVPDGPPPRKGAIAIGEEWWVPRWFVREVDADTGEEHWRFTEEYWKVRAEVASGKAGTWPEWVPRIFELKS
ncbi:hypothetical protein HK102_008853 [Quaeritorhiza haematococci]|nr:hypothetical protein HK102_008853 [Quaeritorhiza haematococci]